MQDYYTVYLTRFPEPTKLLHHPKQKARRGGGLQIVNTCFQVITGKFLRKADI
jgi:hypothetical protein